MTSYYFTEIVSFIPILKGQNLSYKETTQWFKDNEEYIDRDFYLSKIYAEYLRNGFTLKYVEVNDGITTSRQLWKKAAWEQYIKELCTSGDPFSNVGWALGLNQNVSSYSYRLIDEKEKKELIELYFIDYFKG